MTRKISLAVCAGVFFTPILLVGCGGSGGGPMQNPPQATGATPTVAAVATQANGAAPNRRQEVQFSEAMDASTINAKSFTVTDSSGNAMSGSVSYDADFATASFQPNPALAPNTTYTATVSTAAASTGGEHLAKAYTYTFTTRASEDTLPITVSSVSPAANATCVSTTSPITLTFSEAPDASTITAAGFAVTGPAGAAIAVKVGMNVTTPEVTLTPGSPLPTGTITVTANNLADLAGLKMAAPYKWSFSTACGGGGGGGGTGGGGGGTGGGGSATTQYQSPLWTFVGIQISGSMVGQVTVDTAGNTTVQLSGAPASTSYTMQFCPAYADAQGVTAPPCFDVMTVSTDTSGNGKATAKFPQPGNWAGEFYLKDSGGKSVYQTLLARGVSNQTYVAKLLLDDSTNGGKVISPYSPQQEPLSSGSMSYSNGSLRVTVNGALPNNSYSISESVDEYLNGSGSYGLGAFKTDANGNGTANVPLDDLGGDLLQVVDQNAAGAGYIAGFTVSQ